MQINSQRPKTFLRAGNIYFISSCCMIVPMCVTSTYDDDANDDDGGGDDGGGDDDGDSMIALLCVTSHPCVSQVTKEVSRYCFQSFSLGTCLLPVPNIFKHFML